MKKAADWSLFDLSDESFGWGSEGDLEIKPFVFGIIDGDNQPA